MFISLFTQGIRRPVEYVPCVHNFPNRFFMNNSETLQAPFHGLYICMCFMFYDVVILLLFILSQPCHFVGIGKPIV